MSNDRSESDELDEDTMQRITITREDDWFVITDEETGVTTQGESRLEALLMLADALAGYADVDEDLLGLAIDVFVPDPPTAHPDPVVDDVGIAADFDIHVEASLEDRFHEVATAVFDGTDPDAAEKELRTRLAEHAATGLPWIRPLLSPEEIETIEDDRLRAHAWDLDAIARAYNYASDPLLPDLARTDPAPWVAPEERLRLERASALLLDAYGRLLERVGADLRAHREQSGDW